jgi:hypothetical protein
LISLNLKLKNSTISLPCPCSPSLPLFTSRDKLFHRGMLVDDSNGTNLQTSEGIWGTDLYFVFGENCSIIQFVFQRHDAECHFCCWQVEMFLDTDVGRKKLWWPWFHEMSARGSISHRAYLTCNCEFRVPDTNPGTLTNPICWLYMVACAGEHLVEKQLKHM